MAETETSANACSEPAAVQRRQRLTRLSHDLRQPMQACLLLHAVLIRRNRDPALADLIVRLGQSLQAQQDMISQLFDLLHQESDNRQLPTGPVPVAPVLERVFDSYCGQAEAAGIELRLVHCTTSVDSDPAILERILAILVGNALRFTSKGRVLLGCRRAGRYLRLQVWDTGIGIAADRLPQLLAASTSTPGRLTTAVQLATEIGHRLAAWSRPGIGSLFEIRVLRYHPNHRPATPPGS